jgi:nicotinate dehydrogenase subunit B
MSRSGRRAGLSRRQFLASLGGGIFVFFTVGDGRQEAEAQRLGAGRESPADFNAYLRIGGDGKVTCFTGKVELGQGIQTSLAQIAAEEPDLPLEAVEVVAGDTALCPWDMGTFGSRTIKYFGPELRRAAAEARAVLIELAAERLKVPASRLTTGGGLVFEGGNPKNAVPYGTLSDGKVIERRVQPAPTKPRARHAVSGRPAARKDALLKVTGRARYAGDVRRPGMRYARILRPPAHGATLRRVDLAEAEKFPGARVLRDGDLIAVLHDSFDPADAALAKVTAEFDAPAAGPDDRSIHPHLLRSASQGQVVEERGDLVQGERLTATLVEGTHVTPYVAHAPLEPHTAFAVVEKDGAAVWASTQRPFGAQDEGAQTFGVSREKVRVIAPFVGGGFGGKTRNRQVVEAARLAKLSGHPVQVAWSRDEEFFLDTFQPAAVVTVRAGLDAARRLTLWDYVVYFAGERASQPFYRIPHYRIVARGHWGGGGGGAHPFEVGAWRARGSNTNTFARESHMDVLAARAGADPLEFRLANLDDARTRRVLETAATRFNWTPAKAPSGRGVGVSCANYLGTYVAAMAEIAVDRKTSAVRVARVVCAQDMRRVIDPDGATAQIEGCIVMGLGYALSEDVRFAGGRIHDRSFHAYAIPRVSWTPRVEVVLVENPDLPAQGGGEPPIVNMGTVVPNALYDATGARLSRLPMTPARILGGLKTAAQAP